MALRRPTSKAIEQALRARKGNVTEAAAALGIRRESLHHRIKDDPELKEILNQAREALIDEAETALGRAVKKGAPWAVALVLKTLGKSRGYVERADVHQRIGPLDDHGMSEMTDEELRRIAMVGVLEILPSASKRIDDNTDGHTVRPS